MPSYQAHERMTKNGAVEYELDNEGPAVYAVDNNQVMKPNNEIEKRLPCGSLLGGVGVVLGMLVPPLGGRCRCVGAWCLGGTSRATAC
jgi:hypothetical protein